MIFAPIESHGSELSIGAKIISVRLVELELMASNFGQKMTHFPKNCRLIMKRIFRYSMVYLFCWFLSCDNNAR